jgi:rhodanese-related sulfurtransferase
MKSYRTRIVAAVLAGTMMLASCGGSNATETGLQLTPVDEVSEIVENPPEDLVILDIRTPEEFAAGHIAGAINIDYYAGDFEQRLGALDLDVPYVMYCNSGNRSSNALPLMDSIGFSEVYELDGGIQAWFGAGLPVQQ